ncbi:hypothetical protein PRUPE_7G057900 [Prunus persica]|uniref:Uncharacterized protein n=1 Tax=Prunus persica TaxID=3760 RepID=A0A251NAE8_PRUPE|nr:hypothetical protein PRUPE_7G057900 [Prunus persica]
MCLLNILSGAGDEAVAQSTRACGKMEYMRNCQEKPCNDLCWQAKIWQDCWCWSSSWPLRWEYACAFSPVFNLLHNRTTMFASPITIFIHQGCTVSTGDCHSLLMIVLIRIRILKHL